MADDLVHKFLDQFAVLFHIADVSAFAKTVTLLRDLFHHAGEGCLQFAFLDVA